MLLPLPLLPLPLLLGPRRALAPPAAVLPCLGPRRFAWECLSPSPSLAIERGRPTVERCSHVETSARALTVVCADRRSR